MPNVVRDISIAHGGDRESKNINEMGYIEIVVEAESILLPLERAIAAN